MKKNNFIIAGTVSLLAAVIFLNAFSSGKSSQGTLFEANVEALTQQEVGGVTFYLNYFNPDSDILI